MSDNPSMPMFWAEFFSDTEHLPEDAAKAYLFLLGHAWIRGARLPDDDLALARMSRVGPRKWTAIKSIVMGLWYKDEQGFWTQKRLKKEWDFVCRRKDENRRKGSLGGVRSAEKRQAKSTDDAKQEVKQPTPTPTLEDIVLTDSSTPPAVDLLGEPLNPKKKSDPINGHAAVIVDSFVSQWDSIAVSAGLARCRAISDARRKHILARARDLVEAFGYADPIAGFSELFAKIRGSPFLLGRQGDGWKCDLDWILTESKFLKIMEGKYAPDQRGGSARSGIAAGSRH